MIRSVSDQLSTIINYRPLYRQPLSGNFQSFTVASASLRLRALPRSLAGLESLCFLLLIEVGSVPGTFSLVVSYDCYTFNCRYAAYEAEKTAN